MSHLGRVTERRIAPPPPSLPFLYTDHKFTADERRNPSARTEPKAPVRSIDNGPGV